MKREITEWDKKHMTPLRVVNYRLRAGNGRHIRIATKVVTPSGCTIAFTEKLSKKEARNQAYMQMSRGKCRDG